MMLPRHYSTRPLRYIDPSGNFAIAIPFAVSVGSWLIDGALTVAAVYLTHELINTISDANEPKKAERKSANDMEGEPGSTSRIYRKDGNIKQDRTYAEDGWPEEDIDYDHDHGQGKPHKHRWTRKENGKRPTRENRLPGEQMIMR